MTLYKTAIQLLCMGCAMSFAPQALAFSLSEPIEYPTERPSALVAAQLDGRGRPELIVPTFRCDLEYNCQVEIYASAGKRRWVLDQSVTAGDHPAAAAIGDMNGDGAPDLVVANHGHWEWDGLVPVFVPGNVSVHLNDGWGFFDDAPLFSAPVAPMKLVVDDFDGDGDKDVVALESERVVLLRNDGEGFLDTETAAFRGWLADIAARDLDADGDVDLLFADSAQMVGGLFLLYNDGSGNFYSSEYGYICADCRTLAVADLDDDGAADVALGDFGIRDSKQAGIHLLLGDGAGGFSVDQFLEIGVGLKALAAGDPNGDGHVDLAIAHEGETAGIADRLSIAFNDGGAVFRKCAKQWPLYEHHPMDTADLLVTNLEGNPAAEVAAVGFDFQTSAGVLSVLRNLPPTRRRCGPEPAPGKPRSTRILAELADPRSLTARPTWHSCP